MTRPSGYANALLSDLPILEGALCYSIDDPERFFSDGGNAGVVEANRALCGRCPVMNECLNYAMTNGIKEGFWGGKTPDERKRMAKSTQPASPSKRTIGRRSSLNTKAIIKMCEAGVSYPVVADVFKTNRAAVSQVMLRHRRSLAKLSTSEVSQ